MRNSFLFLVLGSVACASSAGQAQVPSSMVGGYPSVSSTKGAPPYVAPVEDRVAELVVTPDVMVVGFSYRQVERTPARAAAELKKRIGALKEKLKAAQADAVVQLGAYSVTPQASLVSVTIQGRIEAPVPKEADYWARADIVNALVDLTGEVVAELEEAQASTKVKADGSRFTPAFGPPQARVEDVEAYRAELTARWVKQVRAFASAASSGSQPLHVARCAPPADMIEQQTIGLREVALTLPFDCALEAH